MLASGGFFTGMRQAASVEAMLGRAFAFAIVMGIVGFFVGLAMDLWRHFRNGKDSVAQKDSSGRSTSTEKENPVASHEVLGVAPNAGPEEITAAYQAMMQKHQRQYGPDSPSPPHQDQARSTTNHGGKTALNLALFLGVPIAVIIGVAWLGSKSAPGGASTDTGTVAADECYSLFEAQNFEGATAPCREAAEQGDAYAQVNLGWMYDTGSGVPEDDDQAVVWFRLAANQGDSVAQSYLGLMYFKGRGVPKDYKKAANWFGRAADQGDAVAQSNLAVMYENGWGVPKDDAKAMKWYRLAAEQGDADAKARLEELAPEPQALQADSWLGTYRGTLFGGATATMRVSQSSAGNLRLKLDMASPQGCSGSFDEWVAPPAGDKLKVEMPYDESSDLQCKVSISRSGSTLRLEELSACHQWHGYECGFEGVLSK